VVLAPPVQVVASSYEPEKFCTLSDHVLWYDGSHTTSLRQQGDATVSSPSDLWVAAGDSHDTRDPYDPRDQLC
jgi:hypothetical protein